jgi:putative transposase
MSFGEGVDLAQTLGAWKGFTARACGVKWQRDFFDHRLRHDESWRAKSEYIAQNPVRAQLAASAEEWPYVWRMGPPEC